MYSSVGKSDVAKDRAAFTITYHDAYSEEFRNKYLNKRSFKKRLTYWNNVIERKGRISSSMDLGCGPGWMTETLSKFSDEVVAIDGSSEMIYRVRTFLSKQSNVSYVHTEITPELFADKFFKEYDLIIMSSVLEYLDKASDVLLSLKSILSKQGELVFSVPNASSWYRKLEAFLSKYVGLPAYRSLIVNSWTKEYTCALVQDLGFQVKKIDFQGDVPLFSQLFFWLPKRYSKVMVVLTIGK